MSVASFHLDGGQERVFSIEVSFSSFLNFFLAVFLVAICFAGCARSGYLRFGFALDLGLVNFFYPACACASSSADCLRFLLWFGFFPCLAHLLQFSYWAIHLFGG